MTENPFREAAREAADRTDAELSLELARLTRLTGAELDRLFPEPGDREKVAQLMAIVEDATEENEKVLRLQERMDELGGVVVRLLGTLSG